MTDKPTAPSEGATTHVEGYEVYTYGTMCATYDAGFAACRERVLAEITEVRDRRQLMIAYPEQNDEWEFADELRRRIEKMK